MANFNGKFESHKQNWETPQYLFDWLNGWYDFEVDIAASSDNAKCEKYLGEEQNALSLDWKGTCWLNPPYGGSKENSLENWVKKAYNDSKRFGSTIVMLIPARTNTNWWHEYCMKASEVMLIKGRPKFGDAKHGLPQPLAIVTFEQELSISPVFSTVDVAGIEKEFKKREVK